MNTRNPRFPLVDAVRAIAALSVFFFHAAFHSDLTDHGALHPWFA